MDCHAITALTGNADQTRWRPLPGFLKRENGKRENYAVRVRINEGYRKRPTPM